LNSRYGHRNSNSPYGEHLFKHPFREITGRKLEFTVRPGLASHLRDELLPTISLRQNALFMPLPLELRTARLLLRRWREEDLAPFAALNGDPRVTEFLGAITREASDEMAERIEAAIEARGFGFWAAEVPGVAPFIGFVGLSVPRIEAHFTPCVEIGWRLAAEHWGHGYATEGAQAALAFGFEDLDLDEIVAFTVTGNRRSRRVMEKLGMTYDPRDDFDYPSFPEGHPLRPHVLYRLPRSLWLPEAGTPAPPPA
jgi:RimJ/RimL family protein N-acetyltransferase